MRHILFPPSIKRVTGLGGTNLTVPEGGFDATKGSKERFNPPKRRSKERDDRGRDDPR